MTSIAQPWGSLQKAEFANIDEILHDKLIFGIRDDKVCDRLLHEFQLTLQEADEI